MDKDWLESQLLELPIAEYVFLDPKEIPFRQHVRDICEQECPRYGTSYACPPAVGTVEECMARTHGFDHAFLFTSLCEVSDITNLEITLATRRDHEDLTDQVVAMMRDHCSDILALSTESCAVCKECNYPCGKPCKHPDRMHPCVESYGILVSQIADDHGICYNYGANIITWFSLILYND